MTGQVSLIAVVLLAVLVGATIPVLYQLYQTFKRARALLDAVAPRLATTLDEVRHAAERFDRIGASFEGRTLAPLLSTGFKMVDSIRKSRNLLRWAAAAGGAIGPAVVAGVRALFARPDVRPMRRGF